MRETGRHRNEMYWRWIVGNHHPPISTPSSPVSKTVNHHYDRLPRDGLQRLTSGCVSARQRQSGLSFTQRLVCCGWQRESDSQRAEPRTGCRPSRPSPALITESPRPPNSLRLYFCSLPQFPSLIKSNPFDFHNRFNYIHLEGSICCRLDKKGEKKVFQERARSGGRQLPVLRQHQCGARGANKERR